MPPTTNEPPGSTAGCALISATRPQRRRIVIIGAGFGGLACARGLGKADVDVVVIDRRNHNLFQPLLYQVATAALSPADISEPVRRTLGRYPNIRVVMAQVTGIDTVGKRVTMEGTASIPYDQLVIATGSKYNYFGKDHWQNVAPGLKTVHEARQIRHRLLLAFEQAELAKDDGTKRALLTSVIIGGGPTGVEMAGAISELGRFMVARDFRDLGPEHLRVVLIEAGPRLLAAFPETLSNYAKEHLSSIGVEVRTGQRVADVADGYVIVNGERLETGCIVWGAGVKASSAHRWLGLENPPGGRIPVGEHLNVTGFAQIYALGDTALALGTDGKPLPALAQVAKQQGEYLGRLLSKYATVPATAPPFRFRNRGNTAVIGRHAAVFDFGRWQMKGRLAWVLWAVIHVYLLINFEKRVLVSVQWIWRYITRQRGARLIDEDKGQSAEKIASAPVGN